MDKISEEKLKYFERMSVKIIQLLMRWGRVFRHLVLGLGKLHLRGTKTREDKRLVSWLSATAMDERVYSTIYSCFGATTATTATSISFILLLAIFFRDQEHICIPQVEAYFIQSYLN